MYLNSIFFALPLLGLSCFVITWFIIRLGFWYLSWYLKRFRGINFKVKVGLYSLRQISINDPNHGFVEISGVWVSSCLLASKCRSWVTLCLSDIKSEIIYHPSNKDANIAVATAKTPKTPFKLPPLVLRLSKALSIQISNFDLKLTTGEPKSPHVLQTSLQEFSILLASHNLETCRNEISTILSKACFKLYKSETKVQSQAILFSFGINLHCSLFFDENLPKIIQKISLQISNPEVIMYQGFQPNTLKTIFNQKIKLKNDSEIIKKEPINLEDILLKIPESILVKIESFDVKWVQTSINRTLSVSLQTVDLESNQTLAIPEGDLTSSLVVTNVTVSSGHLPLASLVKSSIKFKIDHHTLDVNILLNSWHLLYNHNEFSTWKRCMPSSSRPAAIGQNKMVLAKESPPIESQSLKQKNILTNILKSYKIQGQADMNDMFVSVSLPGCDIFSTGLMHSQLTVDLQNNGTPQPKPKILSELGDLNLELLLEMGWCKLGDGRNVNTSVMKRHHQKNTPLCLGMLLLKARDFPSDFRSQCMLDGVKIEISPNLVALALQVHNFSQTITDNLKPSTSDKKLTKSGKFPLKEMCSLQFSLTGANIFMISQKGVGLMARIDSVTLDTAAEKVFVLSEGIKIAPLEANTTVFPCVKCSEVKNALAHIQTIRLTYKTGTKETSVQLLDEIKTEWTNWAHMCAVNLAQEINQLTNVFKKKSKDFYEDVEINTKIKPSPVYYLINIRLQGKINVGYVVSSTHRFAFVANEFTAKAYPGRISFQSEYLCVEFDNKKVFTFMNFNISSNREDESHVINRQSFEGLERKTNKAWSISFEEIKLFFPYKYNFAEAFSEQTLSVFKWFKKVHKIQKKPFDLDSPLPPDLSIKIKLFTMELGDDPFEVKLRDNYELLEDEFNESLKRKMMLDEKIEQLRQTHLLLPTGKIEELYNTLAKKNAEIYIQRSRKLYGNDPMRRSLYTAQFEEVEVYAVADTSYHGKDRVVKVMKEIDNESPFPEEGLEFNTLWCRKISGSIEGISCNLRDFPQAVMEIREFNIWGRLVGAEQEASKRSIRESVIEIGQPWEDDVIERSMTSLKFYHDLTWDIESLCAAHGPCWEPILAQVNLAFESISRPSADPSPALPWWDKMRLLYHGRLTLSAQHLTMLLHASLDPFNTTEQMEFTWTNVLIDWTNAKITMKGDLDIYVHTASKYDDCKLLHVPNVKFNFKLEWLCLGNPDDHHSVMPCAPDKVPEYSINQVHDSYRAFRSQNLNVSMAMETKCVSLETLADIPSMLLYSSTLRWIENLKTILSGISRLTRRGVLFNNTKPRKPQLGRHYRIMRLAFNLHKFRVCYWMSFAKLRGFEILGGRFSLGSEHNLTLKPVLDGLKHRPRSEWNTAYLTCDLVESEIWLNNRELTIQPSKTEESGTDRSYFLSMTRVSYGREAIIPEANRDPDIEDLPTHRLVIHGLKGAWTKNNRDVVFSLFESYTKAKQIKRNLSTEALKKLKMDSQIQRNRTLTANSSSSQTGVNSASPMTRLQSGHVASMLQKLISEAEANPCVYTEDIEGSAREQLAGVAACQTDDVMQKNWLIELVNSQVMLQGVETSGYIIVSASRTEILKRLHKPVWKERSLVSKTTWVGSFECLQYYATVDVGSQSTSVDNVMWLSVENIEEKPTVIISDLPDLVGSGQSVGGVVSSTVGGTADPGSAPLQLQRIVSRCGCQFFYASYGENVNPESFDCLEVPPTPEDNNDPWEQQTAVDTFTLTHHDLSICTNSLQYAMILDILNNVLLYVEPRKKEAFEKLQGMRFKLQLSTMEDQKGPILEFQNQVRDMVLNLRRLEKETYLVHKALGEDPEDQELLEQMRNLELKVEACKEQMMNASEELNMMINCYHETQLSAFKTRQRASVHNQKVTLARRSEVCFKYAQWRLTDADGQLGLADFVMSNFLYSKNTKSDDSVEHLLELGYVTATNLLPNQVYKDVLKPTELQPNIPLDRQRALRIYCRERPPVGGISVKEHFEVNVIPITIGLTHNFFTHMMRFFFPGRYADNSEHQYDEQQSRTSKFSKKSSSSQQRSATLAYQNQDDISKMKERAEKNQTFLYIKIPEVPLRVSYKGGKEKNIEDLNDIALNLHTLEYHNRTWTWLDLLMEMKNDSQKVLLQQAIKQKLQIKSRQPATEESSQPQEEDKARLLLGSKLLGGPEKSSKKGIFSKVYKRD